MFPGGNLLALASQVIAFQTAKYWRNNSVAAGTDGINSPTYISPATDISGSSQAVPRTMYEALGLDLQKTYIMFYTSQPLQDVRRDGAPDLIDYGGSRYSVESNTDWKNQDGWIGAVCVRVGPTP